MRRLVAIFLGFLLLAFAAQSARASVVFMYSAADQTYGWCAGYKYSACETYADNNCRDAGGTDCRLAIECSGGAGAAAFSQDTEVKGFGASCHFSDSGGARFAALEACIAASQAICYTSAGFSPGGSQASESDNALFDRIWYAQVYLYSIGHTDVGYADGVLGRQTRAAIRAFETEIGQAPTGDATDRTLELLSYATLGPQVAITAATYRSSHNDETKPYTYGTAVKPAAPETFSAWLGRKTDEQQRTALAVIAATNKMKCTIPATKIERLGSGEAWNVDCAEGPYLVVINDNTILIRSGHGTVDSPPLPGPDNPPAPGPVRPTLHNALSISAPHTHGAGSGKPR